MKDADIDAVNDDIKLVELIVLYGAPFSGKTYYCEKYILSLLSSHSLNILFVFFKSFEQSSTL
jgi:predicted AAA+ superfamily ATPase